MPRSSPEMVLPKEGEEFGPWMLVGGSVHSRYSRKDNGRGNEEKLGFVQRIEKKVIPKKTLTQFDAIADLGDDEGAVGCQKMEEKGKVSEIEEEDNCASIYEERIHAQEAGKVMSGKRSKAKGKGNQSVKPSYIPEGRANLKPNIKMTLQKTQSSQEGINGHGPSIKNLRANEEKKFMHGRAHHVISKSLAMNKAIIMVQSKAQGNNEGT